MKRHAAVVTALTLVATFTLALPSFAQWQAPPPKGRVSVYGTNSSTALKAPSIAGLPRFDNSGLFWGLAGEVNWGKFTLNGRYQTGRGKVIPGGDKLYTPTFNPMTGERRDTIDVLVGYTVLENATIGKLDLAAGYWRLWAGPMVTPANWYQGPQVGIKGRREWPSRVAINYKIGYLPTYSVQGYLHKELAHKDIWTMRAEGELPVYKNFFLNGGYEHLRFSATATNDGRPVSIIIGGFYVGGGYRF